MVSVLSTGKPIDFHAKPTRACKAGRMADTALIVPPPRPAPIRSQGPLLKLAHRLPGSIHYALAGGGAHGCVQWGLLQALAETDVVPDALVGNSAGALTGAIVAEDPISAVHRLAYVWSQLDVQTLLGDGWLSVIKSATRGGSSLVDSAPEAIALTAILRAKTFEELDLPFAAVTTDLATGIAVTHSTGALIPALLASSAIPGVLPPVAINGRLYVDGLASANLPAQLAVARGADTVIVLDTGSREQTPVSASPTRVVGRVNAILARSQRRSQLAAAAAEVPVILLPTPADLGAAMDFRGTVAAAARAYELGRTFLTDLAATGRGRLKPGLYARASEADNDPELLAILRPVES